MDYKSGLTSFYQTGCSCPDQNGCPPGVCPDATMKRHDTQPSFRISVDNSSGGLDLTDENLVLEVSLWAKAKLRKDIGKTDTYFQLANNIGFNQIMVGDIIVMNRTRSPEYMLVVGFDESNFLVEVQRAYHATVASVWKKGSPMLIFRCMGNAATIETTVGDVVKEDGSTAKDQILDTNFVYNWSPNDTCLPGCYWLEFKLLRMTDPPSVLSLGIEESESETVNMLSFDTISDISFTPSTMTPSEFGCCLGSGVDWVRRFPSVGEGFLVQIIDSPTKEL
jgi:hypothetical protein